MAYIQRCLFFFVAERAYGVFLIRKTNNFLLKNKMLLRMLYWKERKYVLIVVIHIGNI